MPKDDWQPSAKLHNLQLRAHLLRSIRQFFLQRGVLEVETPVLSSAAPTDPSIESIQAQLQVAGSVQATPVFLQTSPEFAMKRLLANGSGAIYQVCKVFRQGEQGSRHNPEFTMLEWYRPGFDHFQLMNEVEELVAEILGIDSITRQTYRQVFQQYLAIDPHQATVQQLKSIAKSHIEIEMDDDDKDTWLNLLLSHLIEPKLDGAVFIYDYPSTQAALAKIERDANDVSVAKRFELFINGMEIANGYFELTDAQEQSARFEKDQSIRKQKGLPQNPADARLLAALQHGMENCAGVALGFDRLAMLAANADHINEVISFPIDRA